MAKLIFIKQILFILSVNILDDAGRILTVCKVTPWTDPSSIASMGDYVVTYEAFVAGHNRVSITLNNLNIVNR